MIMKSFMDEIRVELFSPNENFKILTSHKVAFEQFCHMFFQPVIPLYDRLAELEF